MLVFSWILIVLIAVNFFKSKSAEDFFVLNAALLIAVFSFIELGAFIHIGNISFDPEEVLTAFVTLQALFIALKRRSLSISVYALLTVIAIILGWIWLSIFPYAKPVFLGTESKTAYVNGLITTTAAVNGQSIRYFIRILLFAVLAGTIKRLNKDQQRKIINYCYVFFIITVSYCILEFAEKNVTGTGFYKTILSAVFSYQPFAFLERGRLIPITGFRYEPTQLCSGMMFFLLFITLADIPMKNKKFMFYGGILICALSMSLKGFLYIFVLILIAVILYGNRLINKYLVIFAGAMITAFGLVDFSYYQERILNALSYILGRETAALSSETVRLKSIKEAFSAFFKRPVLGLGLGNIFSYGAVPMVLSNMGFLGTSLWCLNIRSLCTIRMTGKAGTVLLLIVFMLLTTGSVSTLYNPVLYFSMVLLGEYGREEKMHGLGRGNTDDRRSNIETSSGGPA